MVSVAILASLILLADAVEKPVIGIYPTLTAGGYLGAYKEWLAQEGADSIQLPKTFDGDDLEKLFQSINGLLIPGGGRALDPSLHALVNRAVKANKAGDFFPVWGTCLGFEWLVEIFGGKGSIVGGFDSEDLPGSITFTESEKTSRVYAAANSSLISWLQTENITYNAHRQGISPESFTGNKGLTDTFKVLASEKGRKGKPFVAQMEGKTYPFYGNQFHPEKIQFVHSPADPHIPRSDHAVAAARHLAQFFVSEARKSQHSNATEMVVV